ncbi:MAG: aspartate-semialdehyde dehydrogenase [Desulfomonile tiedjei]|uniref:Aspartate-semialdehyde dehydrogenase n=1 Tax=Desulfomonile tiedjei TaxID=2358 RepID=A0A9D6V2S1_9BACT|nr:aspartate-semialdehyde dehydrogenase [Desulfomonile tiedjei]
MKKDAYKVAVVGATGAVGNTMTRVLEKRDFPVSEIVLLASGRSTGRTLKFKGKDYPVHELTESSFKGIDIGLFSAGGSISAKFAPIAAQDGCIVIDNTAHFRMEPDVPLVVPEVNPDAIARYTTRNIIANPNCSTIQMLVALKPLHDAGKILRIVVSTYQSVSGTGKDAIEEMLVQSREMASSIQWNKEDGLDKLWQGLSPFRTVKTNVYPYRIAFECLPQIDIFLENDYTKEEMKMVWETKKILDPSIRVTATAVRVPTFFGHSESVNVETEKKITAQQAKELLSKAPGVKVLDDPANKVYPVTALAGGEDDTLVGRIREDESIPNGLNLWVVSDNILKGAALNAVQIAEILIDKYL